MTAREAYDELIQRSIEASLLASCSALLQWEEETLMPRGGLEHRGNQLALLAGLTHDRRIDPRIGERLSEVEASDLVRDPLSPEAVNVRELRRHYDRATKLPKTLVAALAKTATHAQRHWAEARAKNNFAHFLPWLEKMIALKRDQAECLRDGGPAYDALLDEYEPGAKADELTKLFTALRGPLVELVESILGAARQPDESILAREYPVDRQRIFAELASATLGFDYERGRLDVSPHPFCTTIGPGDCRLTTRFNPHDFGMAFFGTLHETGHGLYEQGLPTEHFGTPMGDAVSLGIHESQSRLWENSVGRSRAFWRYFYPQAQRLFAALRDVSRDAFVFAINGVQPSLNRVEADEVTYNLHILIRFELELAMLHGELPLGDLPAVWNEKYTKYLGVTPGNDAEGCLQDIHWSAGLFGYFPTYTLGNLYGAQLFDKAGQDLGDLAAAFARGEFAPLLEWLRTRIHRQGQRYRPNELIESATGALPSHQPLLASLRETLVEFYQG